MFVKNSPSPTTVVMVVLIALCTRFAVAQNRARNCICSPTITLKGFEADTNQGCINGNVTCLGLNEMESNIMARLEAACVRSRPKDCNDVKKFTPEATTGIYRVYPEGWVEGLRVRCDMTTDGGGWTVFHRRVDGNIQFDRNWREYQMGFGDLETEFWLGNQQIYIFSSYGWNELRIDMTDHNNNTYYAKYQVFSVGNAVSQYVLFVDGFYGDVTFDGMAHHSGNKFSTKDRDNDQHSSHCAQVYHGAWWHGSCHNSNLNGPYGPTTGTDANSWNTGSGESGYIGMKNSEMKMRRVL